LRLLGTRRGVTHRRSPQALSLDGDFAVVARVALVSPRDIGSPFDRGGVQFRATAFGSLSEVLPQR
jgi:hypothetical protein